MSGRSTLLSSKTMASPICFCLVIFANTRDFYDHILEEFTREDPFDGILFGRKGMLVAVNKAERCPRSASASTPWIAKAVSLAQTIFRSGSIRMTPSVSPAMICCS